MKEKLAKIKDFLLNPHLLLCVGIAWLITNGWAYIALGIGTYYGLTPLMTIAGVYLAVLWSPFCLEGIFTALIALFLLRHLFPDDTQTLEKLEDMRDELSAKKQSRRLRRKGAADIDDEID